MNKVSSWVIKNFFSVILPIVTPAILDMIRSSLKNWYEAAIQTDNAWDDILVKFLCDCFDVDVSTVTK